MRFNHETRFSPMKHNWLNQHLFVTLPYEQMALRISMEPILLSTTRILKYIYDCEQEQISFFLHACKSIKFK